MFKKIGLLFFVLQVTLCATENLHPILPPQTALSLQGVAELHDDVYSGDLDFSVEIAPVKWASFYAEGAFRFLSYSYEFSTNGYIHNYCNLHVNGFNETYLGLRLQPLQNFGLDLSWQFSPGEGSQMNRFQRLKMEPYGIFYFSKGLIFGGSIYYQKYLEDLHYKPGEQLGVKASFLWKFLWNFKQSTGWQFSETALYQWRIRESKNLNLSKHFQKMDDLYEGMKFKFEATRYFKIFQKSIGFGFNYEINKGTLFGFETGHRIGVFSRWIL